MFLAAKSFCQGQAAYGRDSKCCQSMLFLPCLLVTSFIVQRPLNGIQLSTSKVHLFGKPQCTPGSRVHRHRCWRPAHRLEHEVNQLGSPPVNETHRMGPTGDRRPMKGEANKSRHPLPKIQELNSHGVAGFYTQHICIHTHTPHDLLDCDMGGNLWHGGHPIKLHTATEVYHWSTGSLAQTLWEVPISAWTPSLYMCSCPADQNKATGRRSHDVSCLPQKRC